MRALNLEGRRSQRYALRLSLLMLDLDAFKRLNDLHGHLFGDLVLQRVGHVLRRALRDADIPCRFGGEEFAVILPETDRLGAYAVAERVRQRVAQGFTEPVRGKTVRVGLSGGIAAYPEDGVEPAELLARADAALYIAKSQGKNRISLYHSERRGDIRYPAKPTTRCSLVHEDGVEPCKAQPLNLSRSGALLEIGRACPGEAHVQVRFGGRDAAGEPRQWTVAGRVVRVEAGPGALRRVAVAFDEPIADDCLLQHVRRGKALRVAQGGRA
jgi:diguanylate cyclase (GGDEF)-like protein